MRILYLHGTFVPPSGDPRRDRFFWLSAELEGDVLQDTWCARPENVERLFGPGSYPVYRSGRFRYHFLLGSGERGLRARMTLARFFICEGLRVHRERAVDCIVTYSHTLTGLCGVILKFLTRARLIIEIVGAPDTIYLSRRPNPGFREKAQQLFSDFCLHVCLWSCDRVHLLAPSLIAAYKRLRNVPRSVFFEGIPVSQIPRHTESTEHYILLVGAPWRPKGVDLLIEAFRRLAPEFPEVKLKLLGYYPDREPLEALLAGLPQVEILKPRANPEVVEIISKATIFVLPSRSEGVPRVILEAMAAGIPVVASDVGGIPSVVRDGENGFVVPVGNVDALTDRLRRLLSDTALRRKMGARGYEMAHAEFSEQAYVDQFARMIEFTVRGSAAAKAAARGSAG